MIDEKKPLAAELMQTDFDLTRDIAGASRWMNPPGDAIASLGQLELWKRSFFENAQTYKRMSDMAETAKGALLHSMGTTLRTIRGHSAWKLIGIETWDEYCDLELKISRRNANRLVSFAGGVTEEQATLGVRRCVAGLRLVTLLGLDRLGDLLPKDGVEPEEWAEALGEPVRFVESTAARIEALAAGTLKPKLPEPAPSARTRRVAARRREIVEAVGEKHPALASLGVKIAARDGKVKQRKPASTDAEFAALAALYQGLLKG